EVLVLYMRILIDAIHPLRVEQRCAPFNTVDFIAFSEKKLSKIGAILTGHACYQGHFIWHSHFNLLKASGTLLKFHRTRTAASYDAPQITMEPLGNLKNTGR